MILFKRDFLKFIILTAAICTFCGVGICAEAKEEDGLRIYLPRETVVSGETIELGQIGVVRGRENVVSMAQRIGLGRFALGGQQIVVDRGTILSRLASEGIKASEVSISGAETVTVRRNERIISSKQLVEAGRSFLKLQGIYNSACSIEPLVKPKDMVLDRRLS